MNNPGAHIWIPELKEKFGATKGRPFSVIENGVQKVYFTAMYPDVETGDKASRFVAKRQWDNVGGDIVKFVKAYTRNNNPQEIAGYVQTISQYLKN
tara:strand:+ start:2940 stop:3227 length:288 start_codon:yes stop_codon:yes gene_type:complete